MKKRNVPDDAFKAFLFSLVFPEFILAPYGNHYEKPVDNFI